MTHFWINGMYVCTYVHIYLWNKCKSMYMGSLVLASPVFPHAASLPSAALYQHVPGSRHYSLFQVSGQLQFSCQVQHPVSVCLINTQTNLHIQLYNKTVYYTDSVQDTHVSITKNISWEEDIHSSGYVSVSKEACCSDNTCDIY